MATELKKREVRLELNLDVNELVSDERLVELIRFGCNVYGVSHVQSVKLVRVETLKSVNEWLDKKGGGR